jgi:hypothetical protein
MKFWFPQTQKTNSGIMYRDVYFFVMKGNRNFHSSIVIVKLKLGDVLTLELNCYHTHKDFDQSEAHLVSPFLFLAQRRACDFG